MPFDFGQARGVVLADADALVVEDVRVVADEVPDEAIEVLVDVSIVRSSDCAVGEEAVVAVGPEDATVLTWPEFELTEAEAEASPASLYNCSEFPAPQYSPASPGHGNPHRD